MYSGLQYVFKGGLGILQMLTSPSQKGKIEATSILKLKKKTHGYLI